MEKEVVLAQDIREYIAQAIPQSVHRLGFSVSDCVQDYVIDMLSSFVNSEQIFRKYQHSVISRNGLEPITFQYLQSATFRGEVREGKLEQLANECLFLTGFFYDFIKKMGASQIRFHCQIGSSAYTELSHSPRREQEKYAELAAKFWELSVVIGDLNVPEHNKNKKLYEMYTEWKQTGDVWYLSLLMAHELKFT